MFVPFDEERGLHPQDQDFLEHQRWDFENTPPDKYPLLLHYPYFQLYRRQVVKQADLVLAMHWRGDAFTPEQKHANFDYYERLTVRDSSLSASTQSILAAEVGHLGLARDYLEEAARMDLEDLAHNTGDGLHMASLAGAVLAAVTGFGGVRDYNGRLSFRPRLPEGIERLRFSLEVRGSVLRVEIAPGETAYSLPAGRLAALLALGRGGGARRERGRAPPDTSVRGGAPALAAPGTRAAGRALTQGLAALGRRAAPRAGPARDGRHAARRPRLSPRRSDVSVRGLGGQLVPQPLAQLGEVHASRRR